MSARKCAIHDEPLVDEPGGDDMPTIYGRTYCPTCQVELMTALDKQELA